jgi:DNA modification methylase
MCGDSLIAEDVDRLMRGEKADFSINDLPYNAKIEGNVSTRKGASAHREFEMASGEMTGVEFYAFLLAVMEMLKRHCRSGAIIEAFMDWRNVHRLIAAAEAAGLDYLNLICWVKNAAGMGSLFRSQHELVGVFRAPGAAHTNRVQLGKHGRQRTNVWAYDGYSGFGSERKKDLDRHPTPKNVQMIQDAILDVTGKGDIVLDLFGGGGTTMIAAERAGRSSRLMEIDPRYCEATLRRLQEETGQAARRQAYRSVSSSYRTSLRDLRPQSLARHMQDTLTLPAVDAHPVR